MRRPSSAPRRGRSSANYSTSLSLGAAYRQVFQTSPRARERLAPDFAGVPREVTALRRRSAGFKSWAGGAQSKALLNQRRASSTTSTAPSSAGWSRSSTAFASASSAASSTSASSSRTSVGTNFRGNPSRPLSAPSARRRAQQRKRFSRPASARSPYYSTSAPGARVQQRPTIQQLQLRQKQRQPYSKISNGVRQDHLHLNLPLQPELPEPNGGSLSSRPRPSSARPTSARRTISKGGVIRVASSSKSSSFSTGRPKSARAAPPTSFHTTATNGRRRQRRPATARPASAIAKRRGRSSKVVAYSSSSFHRATKQQEPKSSSFDLTLSGVDKGLLDEVRGREKKTSETPREMSILEQDLELRPLNPRRPSGSHNAMYFFLCGYQHRLRGNFNHAVVALTRAISLDSRDYRPYVNRAFALVRLGRRAAALKDLEVAASLNPKDPENLFNLGLGYQRSGIHAEAVRAFTQCLEQIGLHLCPPWTEKRRLDAETYLALRRAVYKSRSMSLRQEREYHLAALDMIKSGGAQQVALRNGLTGSYQRALRRGAAAYFDCGELYGHMHVSKVGETQTVIASPAQKKSSKKEDVGQVAVPESVGDAQVEKENGNDDANAGQAQGDSSDDSIDESDCLDTEIGAGKDSPQHDTLWHRLARETRLYPSREHSPKDIDELAGIAHQVQLLSTLPEKHLRRICSHMGVVELQKNEVVFYQGSTPHCLYLVLHGGVSVYLHEKYGHADAVEKEERERIERERKEHEEAANMAIIKATGLTTGSDGEDVRGGGDAAYANAKSKNSSKNVAPSEQQPAGPDLMPMSWEAKTFLPVHILEPAVTETKDLSRQRLRVLDAAASPTVDQGLGRFLVTLHAGSSFGEQALVIDADENADKRRNASCVAESDGVVLLTVSKEDFNRVVRTQLMQEVKQVEEFLRSVALFSMVTSNECMHNLATYAETRHYGVDDVIVAEGTVQEEGIFIVRQGKCEIVAGLPLHDHKSDMEKELHGLIRDAAQTRDPIRRKQYETMIQKLKTEMELLLGGGGSGGVSRRFSVKHNPEESYDYRRMAAFATEIEQSTRRKCWNCNDKGKIIDMKERTSAGSSRRIDGGGKSGISEEYGGDDGPIRRGHGPVDDILDGSAFARMDKVQAEAAKQTASGAASQKDLTMPNHEGEYFVRQKRRDSKEKPIPLAELVPRDAFGFESVFSITAQNKVHNTLTGRTVHVRNRVSLVAKTKVDILFVAKKDFFNFTTFKTRQTMRKKLLDPKLAHLGAYSRIFKDPGGALQRERIWAAYKKRITQGFDVKHAKLAQFT